MSPKNLAYAAASSTESAKATFTLQVTAFVPYASLMSRLRRNFLIAFMMGGVYAFKSFAATLAGCEDGLIDRETG
jgi:hypothetical protein